MEYRIGFKGKYYKLYEYKITYLVDNGKKFKYEWYKFSKVISMNKEKTIKLYPDVPFDNFCNNRVYSNFYRRTLVIENDKFHCGQYAGKCFDMCDDYDYMMWFYNSCATEEQKENLKTILLNSSSSKNNYMLVDNIIVSKEKINEEKEKNNRKHKILEKLKKNLPFIVNFTANIHTDGTYFDDRLQIKIHFNKYKISHWKDFSYGLPIDNKGKAKRIKNKQILILKYEVNHYNSLEDIIVNVQEWQFA